MANPKSLKNPKFKCENCEFNSGNKKDYTRHILSAKHNKTCDRLNLANLANEITHTPLYEHKCENCNKSYKHQSSLCKHKKMCNMVPQVNVSIPPVNSSITPEMFFEFIKQNKELQNVFIQKTSELQNTIIEQNKQIVELSKIQSITNTNSNNTTNNQFNLQFFLNETCKDAMNITDFVNSLKLTTEDFENTGKLGFVEGITKIIINSLDGVDTTKRPMHCTDSKRETLYIKNDNVWEKEDDNKTRFKKVVNQVANKNLQQLNQWKEEHPDCITLDSKDNIEYRKYYKSALGGASNEEDEKFFEKIKRNVLKEIVVDKSV